MATSIDNVLPIAHSLTLTPNGATWVQL